MSEDAVTYGDLVDLLGLAVEYLEDLERGVVCPDGHARIVESRLVAALAKAVTP